MRYWLLFRCTRSQAYRRSNVSRAWLYLMIAGATASSPAGPSWLFLWTLANQSRTADTTVVFFFAKVGLLQILVGGCLRLLRALPQQFQLNSGVKLFRKSFDILVVEMRWEWSARIQSHPVSPVLNKCCIYAVISARTKHPIVNITQKFIVLMSC